MDYILQKRKEVFFNNLVLLGLDEGTFEKKHGIPFHKDMFAVPNKKGYEIVTHFLFSKLTAATGEDYNIPWPLLCKDHERGFQKTCCSHLMNFSQENLVKFPRIFPSLLSTFGGDRFYEVYLAFSCYVLSKTIRKNKNINLLSRPVANQESFSTAKDILHLSTVLHLKKFRNTESISYDSHLIWLHFAKNLEQCLQKLKRLLKINENLSKEKKKIISSLYSTVPEENLKLQKIIEKSYEWLKPIINQRKILNKFFANEERYWQYLSSEIGGNVQNEFLNGQDYNICVTKNLCDKFKNVEHSSEENGKLSVVRFIKLFMAYLTYIIELLKKADLSELHKTCYVEDASSIEDDLNSIRSLNKKLGEEIIPSIEENIEALKLKNCFDDYQEDLELSHNQFFSSLPVQSLTSEEVTERASHFDSSMERIFCLPSSEKHFFSEESHDYDFVSKTNSSEVSSMKSLSEMLVPSDSLFLSTDVLSSKTTSTNSASNKLDEKSVSKEMYSMKDNVLCMDHSLSSKLKMSDLNDLDFGISTPSNHRSSHFKMRGSWLEEDSLNTMTLPDISFDE